ncbi:MAG TPA: hypothetical protein ENN61_06620 [Bacteroidaceae bacterium]|nr:hypothetical protein [Bacteroidaceae bacterium]
MIDHFRYIWQQLIVSALIILTGLLLIVYTPFDLPPVHFVVIVVVMTLITIFSFLIIARSIIKSNKDGLIYMFAGIGLKFFLYLLFILIYWIVTKNISKPFFIVFFLLYLIFTFLMFRSLNKLLRMK